MRLLLTSLTLLCCSMAVGASDVPLPEPDAQPEKVAIKTNLLADALLNVNLGVEVGIAPQWTLDVTGEINTWSLSHQRKWKHWFVQPEFRYWLNKPFSGHFFGIHGYGGQYNIAGIGSDFMLLGTDFNKLNDYRHQGWMLGAGLSYGYAWHFSRHWTLEGEIGIGYAGTHYRIYNCSGCGALVQDHLRHNYWGPTKAAVNLVYNF